MRKFVGRILFCLVIAAVVWAGMLIADRQALKDQLIRFHVVAASDSEADQSVKLQVRDAVLESLQAELENLSDLEQAKAYLQENLPKIENVANRVLEEAGFSDRATVSLCLEEFGTRVYDTFTLPAGIYESLRIVIGEGQGHNWWCVVFPSFCLPAAGEDFADVACGAGLSETLASTLAGKDGYEIRFFLLDALGELENLLHRG